MIPGGLSEIIGWFLAFIFVALGTGLLLKELTRPRYPIDGEPDDSALGIAKQRYARGDLSEKEFMRIKENLKSNVS